MPSPGLFTAKLFSVNFSPFLIFFAATNEFLAIIRFLVSLGVILFSLVPRDKEIFFIPWDKLCNSLSVILAL